MHKKLNLGNEGKYQLVGNLIAKLMAMEELFFWKTISARSDTHCECFHSISIVKRRLAGEIGQFFTVHKYYSAYATVISETLQEEREKQASLGGLLIDQKNVSNYESLWADLESHYLGILEDPRLPKSHHDFLTLHIKECHLCIKKIKRLGRLTISPPLIEELSI